MMRKIIFMMMLVIAALSMDAKAQNSLFNKYDEMPNVTSVYISKAMLGMNPKVINQDFVISKVASKLDAIYVISTFDSKIKKEMKEDISAFVKKGNYELLMKQKGVASSSAFYIKKRGDKVTELIMITEGAKQGYTHLVGEMSFDDIQRITLINGHSYNFSPSIGNNINIHLSDIDFQKAFKDKQFDLKGLNKLKDFKVFGNLENLKDLETLDSLDISFDNLEQYGITN